MWTGRSVIKPFAEDACNTLLLQVNRNDTKAPFMLALSCTAAARPEGDLKEADSIIALECYWFFIKPVSSS